MLHWIKINKRIILYILFLITSTVFSWCLWWNTSVPNNIQTIVFDDYTMTIDQSYQKITHENIIDQRIQNRVIATYTIPWYQDYNNTIIITEDKVSPNIDLADYVQASIGWIDTTRWQYHSLSFDYYQTLCRERVLSSIIVSFSITRSIPDTIQQTLYFVHYYIHRLDKVFLISASTNLEWEVKELISMISTTSCISLADI